MDEECLQVFGGRVEMTRSGRNPLEELPHDRELPAGGGQLEVCIPILTDVVASNGVYHVIDKVLMPK